MKTQINTFWNNNQREDKRPKNSGEYVTIPGMKIEIEELIKNGQLETLNQKYAQKFIFGKRVSIDDLTAFDNFKNIKDRYNNILRAKQIPDEEPAVPAVPEEPAS